MLLKLRRNVLRVGIFLECLYIYIYIFIYDIIYNIGSALIENKKEMHLSSIEIVFGFLADRIDKF